MALVLPTSPDRLVKKSCENFLLGLNYCAQEAFDMGMVNKVVPHEELEETALEWATIINQKSPTAMRMLKFGFNLIDDGLVGQQLFAGEATRLAYGTEEAQEGEMPSWKKDLRIILSSRGTIKISTHIC